MDKEVDGLVFGGQRGAPAVGGGEVDSDGFGCAAGLGDFRGDRLVARGIDVDTAHERTLTRQSEGDRAADVGGGAGDERALAFEETERCHDNLQGLAQITLAPRCRTRVGIFFASRTRNGVPPRDCGLASSTTPNSTFSDEDPPWETPQALPIRKQLFAARRRCRLGRVEAVSRAQVSPSSRGSSCERRGRSPRSTGRPPSAATSYAAPLLGRGEYQYFAYRCRSHRPSPQLDYPHLAMANG